MSFLLSPLVTYPECHRIHTLESPRITYPECHRIHTLESPRITYPECHRIHTPESSRITYPECHRIQGGLSLDCRYSFVDNFGRSWWSGLRNRSLCRWCPIDKCSQYVPCFLRYR